VIIEADNPGGKLFPGMTANISVHIAEAKGVVAVTSAAFRYHPPGEVRPAGAAEKALYMMESNAPPRKLAVKTGLTDGSFTEIKEPTDIVGQEVVLGVMPQQLAGPGASGPSNPFMPKRLGGSRNKGGPPPPR